ncbi:DUF4105 domain-containing protein [Halomonas sp. HP20-15]|uniref:Lnb N-terminal periplasmic domain-containing protein n=1 Tax=Halomonas sp. HP20-15 TaxID=3085901 RepID=UPI00298172C1|nr:DUF4105 domain-containing protein [Halomonas sp. HP20-15]MDW5376068.1 DUF4105 domain-containing protein [Halomonas sp. HP20-15]
MSLACLLSLAGRLLLALVVALSAGWACLALWFRLPGSEGLRITAGALWGLLALGCCVALFYPPPLRWRALAGYLLLFVVLGLWWLSIRPSGERNWAPEVARLVSGERHGDRLTLHNVRNFDWQTPERYTERWETRSYDLGQLSSVDLLASYWMGPAIAHTLVSFGFADGRQLSFSVEIRKERGEAFSTLGGFFKSYEVAVIAADERDIVRLRSNVRGEQVYLYRVAMPPEVRRALLLAYLDEAQSLRESPRFYNTLTSNCTTLVYDMMTRIVAGLPLDYRLLLSGYLPQYVYDVGALADRLSFADLKARGLINERARATERSDDFSARIRDGVPSPR